MLSFSKNSFHIKFYDFAKSRKIIKNIMDENCFTPFYCKRITYVYDYMKYNINIYTYIHIMYIYVLKMSLDVSLRC